MLYQDLDVYKLGVELAIDVHKLTITFPKAFSYGLADQMRRAALSIPCNISEGAMRNNPKEFIQFIGIARGSCAELRTLIVVAEGVGCSLDSAALTRRSEQISKMLTGLIRSMREKASA